MAEGWLIHQEGFVARFPSTKTPAIADWAGD